MGEISVLTFSKTWEKYLYCHSQNEGSNGRNIFDDVLKNMGSNGKNICVNFLKNMGSIRGNMFVDFLKNMGIKWEKYLC